MPWPTAGSVGETPLCLLQLAGLPLDLQHTVAHLRAYPPVALPAPCPGRNPCPQKEPRHASCFPQGPPGLSPLSLSASVPSPPASHPSRTGPQADPPHSSHCGHQSPRSQRQRGPPKGSPPCTQILPGLHPALLFFTAFVVDMIADPCLRALEGGVPRSRAVCPCGLWSSQEFHRMPGT